MIFENQNGLSLLEGFAFNGTSCPEFESSFLNVELTVSREVVPSYSVNRFL